MSRSDLVDDVRAVIASARTRDSGNLRRFVRERLPDATDAAVSETVTSAEGVIDTVPILLAHARDEGRRRGVGRVVEPLLAHASRYFIDPLDLMPEMTLGLAGLLDDAYLSLKLLDHLNSGPEPFFDSDFARPLAFLRSLVGGEMAGRLDQHSVAALTQMSGEMTRFWSALAKEA